MSSSNWVIGANTRDSSFRKTSLVINRSVSSRRSHVLLHLGPRHLASVSSKTHGADVKWDLFFTLANCLQRRWALPLPMVKFENCICETTTTLISIERCKTLQYPRQIVSTSNNKWLKRTIRKRSSFLSSSLNRYEHIGEDYTDGAIFSFFIYSETSFTFWVVWKNDLKIKEIIKCHILLI